MIKPVSLSFVEEISKKAILHAGEIAKKYKNNISIKYKSKNQPVTNADVAIDNYLKQYFNIETPSFGWVSEETKDDKSRLSTEYFWCLDPIDGTRSYINNKPEYTISLALIKKNTPIIGYIFNPETNELFFGKKEFGAFCNNQRIEVNKQDDIFKSKFALSSSEIGRIKKYNFFDHNNAITMGSIAYKVALVAKGKIDIALSFTKKNDWDMAASHLILDEAGGDLKSVSGKNIIYNSQSMLIESVVATNKKLMKKLRIKFNE